MINIGRPHEIGGYMYAGSRNRGGAGWPRPPKVSKVPFFSVAKCPLSSWKILFRLHFCLNGLWLMPTFSQHSGKMFLGALYDCIYFSSLPHGRSKGGPLALVLNSQSKRDSYATACFCNTSLSKICVFFVCKLRLHFPDSKHLRGFIDHEIFETFFRSSFEKFWPTPHQLYMLATGLSPPPVANILGENFLDALFFLKVPLETEAPPPTTFWCFLRPWMYAKQFDFVDSLEGLVVDNQRL